MRNATSTANHLMGSWAGLVRVAVSCASPFFLFSTHTIAFSLRLIHWLATSDTVSRSSVSTASLQLSEIQRAQNTNFYKYFLMSNLTSTNSYQFMAWNANSLSSNTHRSLRNAHRMPSDRRCAIRTHHACGCVCVHSSDVWQIEFKYWNKIASHLEIVHLTHLLEQNTLILGSIPTTCDIFRSTIPKVCS